MAGPFIKSAGGKRLLAPALLKRMPPQEAYDTYVEVFTGGGAPFFALWSERRLDDKLVILNDLNVDLVNLYEAVRDDVLNLDRNARRLIAEAMQSGDARSYFERQRALWNTGGLRTPARQLYLRKACFNGLWRQNKAGELNTSWNKAAPTRIGTELMHAMAALKNAKVEFLDWDFRRFEGGDVFIGPRTLVYLDPPYLGGDRTEFTSYTQHGWNKATLVDLLTLCQLWTERGAHVVLSHSDTPVIRALLSELWPSSRRSVVQAKRSINSDPAGRGPVRELIVVGKPPRPR